MQKIMKESVTKIKIPLVIMTNFNVPLDIVVLGASGGVSGSDWYDLRI